MLSRNEIKYIQTLFHKKNRDQEGLFIAEGVKIADELINSGFSIQKIYAIKDWADKHAGADNITVVTEDELKRISNLETPNQVVAVIRKKVTSAIPDLHNKITLLLDGIQDPGNLGTIIRTADWFGVQNIIASPDTADVYNSKVVQSTMGSIARVNIIYTDLQVFLSANIITVCGAMLDGENIKTFKHGKECLLVIGNESKGIRDYIKPFIQKRIAIPKTGSAESLNAAVAASIILYKLCAG